MADKYAEMLKDGYGKKHVDFVRKQDRLLKITADICAKYCHPDPDKKWSVLSPRDKKRLACDSSDCEWFSGGLLNEYESDNITKEEFQELGGDVR